jgi:hypothetical protein
MIAKKGNRQYQIAPSQVDSYLKQGFDILSNDGKLVKYGMGKTISYSEYQRVLDELNKLKENGVGQVDKKLTIANDKLQAENEDLKLEVEALQNQIEKLKLDLEAAKSVKSKK